MLKAGWLSSFGLSLWFLVCWPFLCPSPTGNSSLAHVSSCRARGDIAQLLLQVRGMIKAKLCGDLRGLVLLCKSEIDGKTKGND